MYSDGMNRPQKSSNSIDIIFNILKSEKDLAKRDQPKESSLTELAHFTGVKLWNGNLATDKREKSDR